MEIDDAALWHLGVAREDDRTVLRAAGDLDLETAPHLLAGAEPHLVDGPPGGLVLDLSALTFIDSSGLSALIRLNQRMAGAGRPFEIVPPAPTVAKALEITGLDQVLPLRRPQPG